MRSVDLGFRPEHVTTAAYSLPQKQYATQPAVDAFNDELLRRLRQLPGVTSVGLTSLLPASGNNNNQTFVAEGYTPPKGANMNLATVSQVTGDYFPGDGDSAAARAFLHGCGQGGRTVGVIVNRALAQHYWPNQDPIGKRMRVGTAGDEDPVADDCGRGRRR